MTKLYLHVGTHKTGTTAIQKFCLTHHSQLQKRGLLYPDLKPYAVGGRYPHHDFAHALARAESRITEEAALGLPARWAEQAARINCDVLISSEAIYRHIIRNPKASWFENREKYLRRLADALRMFDVEVLIIFRRPDDFVRSLFQESVMKQSSRNFVSFADFRKNIINRQLMYHKSAALFESIFKKVRLFIFDDIVVNGNICHNFFNFIGKDVSDIPDQGVVRQSMTPAQTMLKLFINSAKFPGAQNEAVLSWIKSPSTTEMIDRYIGPGPFDIWESAADHGAFMNKIAPEMERLRAEFFSERPVLFPEKTRDDVRYPGVPAIPDELKAALLQNQIFQTGK